MDIARILKEKACYVAYEYDAEYKTMVEDPTMERKY